MLDLLNLQGVNVGDQQALFDTAREIVALQVTIIKQYTPVVAGIISSNCRDRQEIQHVLDRLLDVACHPEGLVLFKCLCRYYYEFDPEVATFYVMSSRELWDIDDLEHQ